VARPGGSLRSLARSGRTSVGVALTVAALAAGCGGSSGGLAAQGRRVFVSAGCGDCHALAAVHARGGIGPDFDTSEPLTRAQIRLQLDAGVGGMPSFRSRLTRRQQDAVVEFVYEELARQRKG
jgi:mono/diheme cytochrome c family protein